MAKINYFQRYGQLLLQNGFNCVPIISGLANHKSAGKRPAMKKWQRIEFNQTLLDQWVERYPRCGIGLTTRFFPAVDIDCLDPEGAEYMVEFVENMLGQTLKRVGRAPKILMVFRTESPFSKVRSHEWIDSLGDKHHVEILGSGQQFVAFGIHPVTRKPYQWIDNFKPTDCDPDLDIPLIDLDQARKIAAEFDRFARSKGWTPDPTVSAMNGGDEIESWGMGIEDDEDWLEGDDFITKWEGTVEELAAIFEDLPPEDTYDKWYPVLAALKDAEREPDEFRDIAQEWSAKSDNYDEDAFNDKWDNGSFGRAVGRVANLRSIVRRVEVIRREKDVTENVIPDFQNCVTLMDWKYAANRMREAEVFGTVREVATEVAIDAFKRLSGLKKVPKSVYDDLAFDFTQFDAPAWLDPWVFDRQAAVYIDRRGFSSIGPYSFNMINAKHLKEIGVKKQADKFASEDYPIPIIDGLMYYPAMHGDMPGSRWEPVPGINGPQFFNFNGKVYLNTFDPSTLPAMPETFSKADHRAIAIVQDFFRTQFPDPKEYQYAMDFLAWVINNPTKKMSYAMIVVGCEGSGKTIIKKFMTYMMGGLSNVGTISNKVLGRDFTDWAEGHILKVIEEISIPGHRYDIVNTLKEPIANESLQMEGKRIKAVEKINTASYLGFTNEKGAIPVGKESRRYLIVSSVFQEREQVLEFMAENPRFFKTFELAFLRHTGAIRKWFSTWQYSPKFNHEGHAPDDTAAKTTMKLMNEDSFIEAVENAMSSGDVSGITEEVIHANGIASILPSLGMRPGHHIARKLSEMGFKSPGSGRARVRLNGVQGTVYVKNIEKWTRLVDGVLTPDLTAVASHLQKHDQKISDLHDDEDDI